jgi:hypothetical protein
MGGKSFAWRLDQTLGYYSDDRVVSIGCLSGIDMILRVGEGRLRIGPSQAYRLNPYDEVEDLYRGQYYVSAAGALFEHPLPLRLGGLGPIVLGLGEAIEHCWAADGFGEAERREAEASLGPAIKSSQSLSLNDVDWIGNLRRGFAAKVSAAEDYDLGADSWSHRFGAYASAYGTLGSRLGVSGRIMASRRLNDSDELAGEPLRGVLDTRIEADAAIYANLDLCLKLWRFAPGERSGNRKWRAFWFEQYLSPFVDAALAREVEGEGEGRGVGKGGSGRPFGIRDAWCSGGLETIVFPLAFKSYYVRISMGWDLKTLFDNLEEDTPFRKALVADSPRDGEKGYELFIGLGSHY